MYLTFCCFFSSNFRQSNLYIRTVFEYSIYKSLIKKPIIVEKRIKNFLLGLLKYSKIIKAPKFVWPICPTLLDANKTHPITIKIYDNFANILFVL